MAATGRPFPGAGRRSAAMTAPSPTAPDITVVIADDHPGFRAALEAMLHAAPGIVLLGSAGCGEEAVSLSAALRPRVVLMDLMMPGVNGVDATRRVRAQPQPPAVIALSGSPELMPAAVRAGAARTLLKEEDPDVILDAIRAAATV
jgi:DNA-binding NarL/FixJ family response regulator